MELKFWIWLIIVIATVLIRALRKAPKPEQPNSYEPPKNSERPAENRPISFEELLREIEASKTPPTPERVDRPPVRQLPSKSEVEDYDDNIPDEKRSYEEVYERKPVISERTEEIYEKAKQEAFNRPSLEESMKLQDTIVRYSHFKEYEESERNTQARDILQDFKDPDGFKKAFIMSEILKPKF